MVKTYIAKFFDLRRHGEIMQEVECEASSAQDMANIVRSNFGADIEIYAIYECVSDWE